jgi:phosphoribosyl-AMP cyclohydrolase
LVPTIVQDFQTGEVLMLAFMNEEAWRETLTTGKATYWSRTRQELWVKGKTSGHVQRVKEIRIDCDSDTVLLKVEQVGGAACHTGYRSCFFKKVEGDSVLVVGEKIFDPKEVYE